MEYQNHKTISVSTNKNKRWSLIRAISFGAFCFEIVLLTSAALIVYFADHRMGMARHMSMVKKQLVAYGVLPTSCKIAAVTAAVVALVCIGIGIKKLYLARKSRVLSQGYSARRTGCSPLECVLTGGFGLIVTICILSVYPDTKPAYTTVSTLLLVSFVFEIVRMILKRWCPR